MYFLIMLIALSQFMTSNPMTLMEEQSPKVYFYAEFEGVETLTGFDVPFEPSLRLEGQVEAMLEKLFTNPDDQLTLIPKATQILNINFKEGSLELTVTNDIMEYGGTLWEWGMINQILATLFSLEAIDTVSIWIDGTDHIFTEGTRIDRFTKNQWNERKEVIWQEWMAEKEMRKEK